MIGQAVAMNVDCLSVIGEDETIGEGRVGTEVEGKNALRVVRFEAGSPVAAVVADLFDI